MKSNFKITFSRVSDKDYGFLKILVKKDDKIYKYVLPYDYFSKEAKTIMQLLKTLMRDLGLEE